MSAPILAIDAMGGDFGPHCIVPACIASLVEHPSLQLILVGLPSVIEPLIAEHRFLQDLFHRLNVIQIHVPPVRDRDADILVLWEHHVADAAQRRSVPVPTLTPDAAQLILVYAWPVNVAEVKKVAEHMIATNRSGVVTVENLSSDIQTAQPRY